LARLYEREGFVQKSIAEYELVVAAMPRFSQALLHLGYMYFYVGRYDCSRRVLSRALEIDEDSTAAMSTMATLCYFAGTCSEDRKFKESIGFLKRALETDPENVYLKTNEAIITEAECRKADGGICIAAIQLWEDVIARSPSSEMKDYARTRIRLIRESAATAEK
jgi:tetratricopeptide (TPR) repeat protein